MTKLTIGRLNNITDVQQAIQSIVTFLNTLGRFDSAALSSTVADLQTSLATLQSQLNTLSTQEGADLSAIDEQAVQIAALQATVAALSTSGGSGGGGAMTIADGADVAEGATTDTAVTGDTAGTVSGKLRGLSKIFASVWDAVNGRLKVDGSAVTQPVSAAALPLPAGAATAANQGTANTSLASLDTKTPALVAGRQPVDPSGVTSPISAAALPLPAGAATAANQATANTSLGSIDTKTPALVTGRVPVDGSGVTQPISNANLDVALSTRLKPADTLAGVTTVGAVTSITNPLPAGTNAIGKVQDAQPGRSSVNMFAEAVAGLAAETAITMSVSKANGTVATGTSFTPTAGKNFRITCMIISWVSTSTTANTCRVRLRVNASGAAIITSPIQFSARIAWESPTFIANEGEFQQVPIPEGLEIPNGGGLMLTQICAAANGSLDISITGYEYTP